MTLRFKRYVAIGDSSTEGLQDPDGAGGYHGWANRLAERVAQAQGGLLYANLGVRGKIDKNSPSIDLYDVWNGQSESTPRSKPDRKALLCRRLQTPAGFTNYR